MKWPTLILASATCASLVTGCYSPDGRPDNTATGALAGGAFGAFTGAVVGGPRNGGAGALIGAAAGAVAGGLIGHSIDEQQQARLRSEAPQTYTRVEQNQPLAIADVKALAKAAVSDDVIITQIELSHTIYHLSASDIIDLHNAGVSPRVINYMINTPNTATPVSATVAASPPPPPPSEVVVVAPSPDWVWIAGEWEWNGRWIWVAGHWAPPPYTHAVWIHGYWTRGPHGWYRVPGRWR